MTLTHRKARIEDMPKIIELLSDDDLGKGREIKSADLHENYINAFQQIDGSPHQYLMVVEKDEQIVATCHLTLMPSLTFVGSTRMQIEAVRVAQNCRGQKIGSWMFNQAILYAKAQGVSIIQLTTNKKRPEAKRFYEKLGFEASHDGMKLCLWQES